jgi:hypothetical protein
MLVAVMMNKPNPSLRGGEQDQSDPPETKIIVSVGLCFAKRLVLPGG